MVSAGSMPCTDTTDIMGMNNYRGMRDDEIANRFADNGLFFIGVH